MTDRIVSSTRRSRRPPADPHMTPAERAVWRDVLRRVAEYAITQRHVRLVDTAKAVGCTQADAKDALDALTAYGVVGSPYGATAKRDVLVSRVPRTIPSSWLASRST